MRRVLAAVLLVLACVWPLSAQWTNRYQRIGQGHHVYVEGYDFPTYSVGPTYPAVSPDGRWLAFSARGWLWTTSIRGGVAERITKAAGMDSRPAWHPSGSRLAFVRDDTRNTDIVELDLASGSERVLAGTAAAELDPAYTPDGQALYFASAETGDLEIYRLDLTTQQKRRVTDARGLDLRPQPLANGALVFVSKRPTGDEITVIDGDGTRRVIALASIASLARPAISPDGRRVVVPLPVLSSTAWALQLIDVAGGPHTEIVSDAGHPIAPAWSADGRDIYFARADSGGVFGLWRVAAAGGTPQPVSITTWDWKTPTARVSVRVAVNGSDAPVAARVRMVNADGHPAFAERRQAWLDGQSGHVYAYTSSGELEFEVPAGEYHIEATRGFEYALARWTRTLMPNSSSGVTLALERVAGAALDDWYSGDHHFHLNYGGQTRLAPEALVPMLRGEDLDVATPLAANLHTRRLDEGYFAWTRFEPPFIRFGQEVRSHFLGHTGHIGVKQLYWRWYWGPGYPVYGLDDRSNEEALQQTRKQGGVNSYVHPVTVRAPFGGKTPVGLPLELVSDAVLGDVDTIELACLWSDELGTADAWYRLLNVGVVIAPSAGTDAMVDFFRTMAVGTTRVYVNVPEPFTLGRYLDRLKAGHSFVTTGPLLRFTAGGGEPGDVIPGSKPVEWELAVSSPLPFDRAEILVNGEVAWSGAGLDKTGTRTYRGTLAAPAGGWIAARVHGGATGWPAMDSYPFAHTAPLWFGRVGSTDPAAARRAAAELLAALAVAEERVRTAYKEVRASKVLDRIAFARDKLQKMVR
jgi:TolB protein